MIAASRVGLRLSGMQVSDATHRQARQIPDEDVFGLRDGDRQGADRGRLVDDHEDGAVLFEFLQHRPHLGLVIWQCLVEDNLASLVQGDGVVFSFADIDTDEHVDAAIVLDHHSSVQSNFTGLVHGVKSRHPRYERPRRLLRVEPLSAITRRPIRSGDNTPRIIDDWGQQSCRT